MFLQLGIAESEGGRGAGAAGGGGAGARSGAPRGGRGAGGGQRTFIFLLLAPCSAFERQSRKTACQIL